MDSESVLKQIKTNASSKINRAHHKTLRTQTDQK
jgi:hypothetical protein